MAKCSQCGGEGYTYNDEDGRRVRDACYHCATTGQVDAETDFHDSLARVAHHFAYQDESDYRKWANEDPDGDGYSLHAAENGMSDHDYFRVRVWEREPEYLAKIAELPQEMQEVLVAWDEYLSHR